MQDMIEKDMDNIHWTWFTWTLDMVDIDMEADIPAVFFISVTFGFVIEMYVSWAGQSTIDMVDILCPPDKVDMDMVNMDMMNIASCCSSSDLRR